MENKDSLPLDIYKDYELSNKLRRSKVKYKLFYKYLKKNSIDIFNCPHPETVQIYLQYKQDLKIENAKKREYKRTHPYVKHILTEEEKYLRRLKNIYKSYINSAKYRNLKFELTQEQFCSLLNKPCFYCNDIAFGVDRIDSFIGYQLDNVVSCCGICNHMKMQHSQKFFITHCKKIASHS